MKQDLSVPVIAIDGVAGAGKGTVAKIIGKELGFTVLDSGALYRCVAYLALKLGRPYSLGDLSILARRMLVRFPGERVTLNYIDVTEQIRAHEVDLLVPHVASIPEVRSAVRDAQISLRLPPGLVPEGRDMGYIFDTPHRFYLDAEPEERAKRRMRQNAERRVFVEFSEVLEAIIERDKLDSERTHSPLRRHPSATLIDTTKFNEVEVASFILTHYRHDSLLSAR